MHSKICVFYIVQDNLHSVRRKDNVILAIYNCSFVLVQFQQLSKQVVAGFVKATVHSKYVKKPNSLCIEYLCVETHSGHLHDAFGECDDVVMRQMCVGGEGGHDGSTHGHTTQGVGGTHHYRPHQQHAIGHHVRKGFPETVLDL